jgi:hypothetical protein
MKKFDAITMKDSNRADAARLLALSERVETRLGSDLVTEFFVRPLFGFSLIKPTVLLFWLELRYFCMVGEAQCVPAPGHIYLPADPCRISTGLMRQRKLFFLDSVYTFSVGFALRPPIPDPPSDGSFDIRKTLANLSPLFVLEIGWKLIAGGGELARQTSDILESDGLTHHAAPLNSRSCASMPALRRSNIASVIERLLSRRSVGSRLRQRKNLGADIYESRKIGFSRNPIPSSQRRERRARNAARIFTLLTAL